MNIKKITALLLAALLLTLCTVPAFAAKEQGGAAEFTFRSDIAGLTENDVEKFIYSNNPDYVFDDAIVGDCTGAYYHKAFRPGRTYDIFVTFVPAEGCRVPVDESDIVCVCEKGAEAYPAIAQGGEHSGEACIMFYCSIKVQGNFLQQIIGAIADLFIKIRGWSPY